MHITEPGPYAAWVIYAGFNFTDLDARVVPQTKAAAIKTGGPNVLRVVTKGSLVALYVNGQSIGSLQLMPPAAGGTVGFEGEGITGKVSDYVFSNLSVSD